MRGLLALRGSRFWGKIDLVIGRLGFWFSCSCFFFRFFVFESEGLRFLIYGAEKGYLWIREMFDCEFVCHCICYIDISVFVFCFSVLVFKIMNLYVIVFVI